MSVEPLALRQMTTEAGRIVHGRVLAVRGGRDEQGLPATWITLEVVSALKGESAARLEIKQFGVADPLPDGTATSVAGMPRFAPGEEVVLFLRSESALGFTSPIGFERGVYRTTDGRLAPRAGGAIPDGFDERPATLESLLRTVRELVAHPDRAP